MNLIDSDPHPAPCRFATANRFIGNVLSRKFRQTGRSARQPVDIPIIFAVEHGPGLCAGFRKYQGLTRRVKMATPDMKMAADAGSMKKPLSPNNADVIFEKSWGMRTAGSIRFVKNDNPQYQKRGDAVWGPN